MPQFNVIFERKVTQRDQITRVIEADNARAAEEIADQMAGEFDSDCPDDTVNNVEADYCHGWEIHELEPVNVA